ncbi:chromosome partitioning protein ParB [Calothrix sp. UHCC 0171]|uniref:ParB/Srx family N-terminal domain-containing protein n=1 Tax=Calothrix sp. UHCC 0171 TaxID=3110245 RepID=UPI002B1F9E1B|nr:chromosome partitioning protein ParB [Calothrix sp. UHCC 0171]MEA5570555.1 chromosome partitioning protein ParB [Calothrix sp. UHCC 0171]
MTNFLMIDVSSINSNISRSSFQEEDLATLADMILESGGLLKPLVLRKIGFEKYEVVDGHFEYYAAVKAREKNPSEGEMVNAFVIVPEEEDLALNQLSVLKQVDFSEQTLQTPDRNSNFQQISTNYELSSLEKQVSELRIELMQERQNLYDSIQSLQNKAPRNITPLEVFNTLTVLDLVFRLRTGGFNDKKAVQIAEIIEKERNKKQFESLSDVITRVKIKTGKRLLKGISADKMVQIVDTWSRVQY